MDPDYIRMIEDNKTIDNLKCLIRELRELAIRAQENDGLILATSLLDIINRGHSYSYDGCDCER